MAALNLGDILVRMGLDASQFTRELRGASRNMTAMGGAARTVGATLTAAITLPLALAGKAAVTFAAEFDSAMTQSVAIMVEFSNASKLSSEQQALLRAEMEDTARTVAKDLNIGAAQAAESFFFLASAGLTAEQQIKALPQVAAFAKAGMFDMATATDLATDAQSALGLKAQDAEENLLNLVRVTDVLVRANTLANASVEQFSTALTTKAGASLKIVNKDIEEGVAVLAAFADQGIKAEKAGTALSIILRDLSTKSIKNTEAFKAAGVAVFDSAGKMNNLGDIIGDLESSLDGMSDATSKATLLSLGFSDKSIIFIQTLIGQSEAIKEYEKNLRLAGGTTQEVADKQLQSFSEGMGLIKRRLIDAAITLGQSLIPMIETLLQVLDPVIRGVEFMASAFGNLPGPIQVAVVAFLALIAAIPVLLLVGGQLLIMGGSLILLWPSIAAGAAVVGGAISTVAGVVGGAVAGFSLLAAGVAGLAGALGLGLGSALVNRANEIDGLNDPIDAAVANVGLLRGGFSLVADVFRGLGGVLVDLGAGFINIASKIPGVRVGIDLLTGGAGLLGKAWDVLAILADELGQSFELLGSVLFKVDTATQDAVVNQGKLGAASFITGRQITDLAEAQAILDDQTRKNIEGSKQLQEQQKRRVQIATGELTVLGQLAERLGITESTLRLLAEQQGINADKADQLIQGFDQLKGATERWKDAQEAARQTLLDMVGTQAEALSTANELATAIQMSGGVTALTASEIERLAGQFMALAATGATLNDTQVAVVDSFLKTQAAALTASANVEKLTTSAKLLTEQIESVGGATRLSVTALADAAKEFKALETAGGKLTETQAEVVALNKELEDSQKAATAAVKEAATAQAALTKSMDSLKNAAGILTTEAGKQFEVFATSVAMVIEETGGVIEDGLEQAIVQAAQRMADQFPALTAELNAFLASIGVEAEVSGVKSSDAFDSMTASIMAANQALQAFGIDANSSLGQVLTGVTNLAGQFEGLAEDMKKGGFGVGGILGSDAKASAKIAAGAQAAAAGIASVIQATSTGTTTARAGKGALAGAAAGAEIGGPIGAAVGGAAGAIVGFFRGKAAARLRSEIEDAVGASVSEAMADGIKASAKDLDVTIAEAALLNLADIFVDVGGVAEFGLEKAGKAMLDLTKGIIDGSLPAKEATEELGQAFTLMAQETVEAGKIADAALLNTVASAKAAGLEIPEIAAFIADQLAVAAKGIANIIGAAFEVDGEMVSGGIQVTSVEDAQAQATIFAAGFFATLEEQGLRAAVEVFGPAFDEMKAKLEEFGAEVDFGGVSRFFEIAADPKFGPLLDGVQGLNDAMVGLANAGFLTADTFSAFQQQAGAAFDQLIEAGLTAPEALQQLAPTLQAAIDASERFGFTLDDNTLALIEQAEAAGIGFETDPMNRMVEVLEIVALALGATAEQLGLVGNAGASAGQAMADSFSDANESIEKGFDDLEMGSMDSFDTIATGSEGAISATLRVGDAALNAASDFNKMASAAANAAAAAGSAQGPGGGGGGGGGGGDGPREDFQFGGLVTGPTQATLGLQGPELVLPLGEAARTVELMGAVSAGRQAPMPMQLTIQIGSETFLAEIEDATRTNKIRIHNRSVTTFGD